MIPSSDAARLLDLVAGVRDDLGETIDRLRSALPALAARQALSPALTPLTPTERELAHLLRTTRSASEIARARGVSVNTVKSQMRSIYGKLGVSRREEALRVLESRPD
nr:helix-turn-helix transcriptional regulator [Microbacterium sp. TL13]